MDLWKEQEEEDRRIFPKNHVDEFREELARWIKGMNITVTLVATGFANGGGRFVYEPVPDDYRGEGAMYQIRVESMGTGVQEIYSTEFGMDRALSGNIAQRMVDRWGSEFARQRFLKDETPRVTTRR